jgi:hypothetical protein
MRRHVAQAAESNIRRHSSAALGARLIRLRCGAGTPRTSRHGDDDCDSGSARGVASFSRRIEDTGLGWRIFHLFHIKDVCWWEVKRDCRPHRARWKAGGETPRRVVEGGFMVLLYSVK